MLKAESSSELFRSPFVGCLSVCLSVRLSVCKLFTFSSFSQEPLGQFQPNWAQSIKGYWEFKFVQFKDCALFQEKIITKLRKYIDKIKKSFSSTDEGESIFFYEGSSLVPDCTIIPLLTKTIFLFYKDKIVDDEGYG